MARTVTASISWAPVSQQMSNAGKTQDPEEQRSLYPFSVCGSTLCSPTEVQWSGPFSPPSPNVRVLTTHPLTSDCWSSWRGQIKYSTPVCERGTDMIGVDGRGPQFEVLTDSATLISVLGAYHQRHREWMRVRGNWERQRERGNEQKHLWSGQGQRQHVSEAFWCLTPFLSLSLFFSSSSSPCIPHPQRPHFSLTLPAFWESPVATHIYAYTPTASSNQLPASWLLYIRQPCFEEREETTVYSLKSLAKYEVC